MSLAGPDDHGLHSDLVDEAVGAGEGEACQHIAQFADVAGPRTRGETERWSPV